MTCCPWRSTGRGLAAVPVPLQRLFGQRRQIGLVEQIFDWFREENTLVMVDPVMGDGGKLYKTYTPEMASGMAACAAGRILWCPT